MPQPALPPTPASSTDIKGKDGINDITGLQMAFELPPPAMTSSSASASTSPSKETGFQSSKREYPVQPSETVKSRRRSSAANREAKVPFELPPPPTRSRKIIQMKPKKQEEKDETTEKSGPPAKATGSGSKSSGFTSSSSSSASTTTTASTTTVATAATPGSKKKQPSATSAAGRKIARKTAHSLIERRRRSKMNEEFAVLKGMIPACTGEMHKLAILQASIEYVRYLEDCVSKLKTEREEREHRESSEQSPAETPTVQDSYTPDPHHHHHQYQQPQQPHGTAHNVHTDPESADVEMTGSTVPSPTYSNAPSSHRASISPALPARDPLDRRESYSSSASADRRFSYTTSATTSPAFGPQTAFGYGAPGTLPSLSSALTSPALGPQGDPDHEATAALMMLNADRRGYFAQRHLSGSQGESGPKGKTAAGRGMSVRDLLST